MYDMHVPSNELSEWVNESKKIKNELLNCYKAVISDMTDNVLTDSRSRNNHHIVNQDFEQQPKYMMGFLPNMERHEFILSALYVAPKFRGRGYGKKLVKDAQSFVRDQGFIQVAVEYSQINKLDRFYKDLGFITTGDKIPNVAGKIYQDYFWSGKKITLTKVGNRIGVQPQSS
jgi:GNAT superfamily N-acetyltransferase